MNSSPSSSRALKCLLISSEVSEDMIYEVVRRRLGVGLGVCGCSLIQGRFWQHSVKTDNAAPGSSGLYRIIAARCINLLLQRPENLALVCHVMH